MPTANGATQHSNRVGDASNDRPLKMATGEDRQVVPSAPQGSVDDLFDFLFHLDGDKLVPEGVAALRRTFQGEDGTFREILGALKARRDDGAEAKAREAFKSAVGPLPLKSRLVDLEGLLHECLNNVSRGIRFELCSRNEALVWLTEKALSDKGGSDKPRLIVASAMRGAGKTALLKHWIGNRLKELGERGRVLVVEATRSWFSECVSAYTQRGRDEERFIVELIQAHLSHLPGCPSWSPACLSGDGPVTQNDVDDAYAHWKQATAAMYGLSPEESESARMRPLIAVDTCEGLVHFAHQERRHSNAAGPYNLLEAVASTVPKKHALVAFGTLATVRTSDIFATNVNTSVLPHDQLGPLPVDEALDWFKRVRPLFVPGSLPIHEPTFRIVHAVTGGIPRLLDEAAEPRDVSLLSWAGQKFEFWQRGVFMPAEELHKTLALAGNATASKQFAAAAMASLTRWNAWPLRVPGAGELSLEDAVGHSMGSLVGNRRLAVPPVFVRSIIDDIVGDLTGLGSLELQSMVLPFEFPNEPTFGPKPPATYRGAPFEKLVLHTLLCRYVLARWKCGPVPVPTAPVAGQDANWVSLKQLFRSDELPVDLPRLFDDWQVNLSRGITKASSGDATYAHFAAQRTPGIQWNIDATTAHHDAYMWGRKVQADGSFDEAPIALQMRHGNAKLPRELLPQLYKSKSDANNKACAVPLLVSLHGGNPSAPALTTQSEKWPVGTNLPADDIFLELNTEFLCSSIIIWAMDVLSSGATSGAIGASPADGV